MNASLVRIFVRIPIQLLTLALASVLYLAPTNAQEVAKDLDALIALSRSQVTNGHFLEALESAQQAILRNKADFRGHYYAAFALFKQGRLNDAEEKANQSLAQAPDEKRPDVQRLIDAIRGQRNYLEAMTAGEEAFQEGLLNKAASNFTQAWSLNPGDQKSGLKAAHLWAEKLSNAPEAARILKRVLAAPNDSAINQEASQLLLSIQPQLENHYRSALERGIGLLAEGKYDEAIKPLEQAEAILPEKAEPHIFLARAHAGSKDLAKSKKEILAAVKNGMPNSDPIISNGDFRALLADDTFTALLHDIFGPGEASRVKGVQERWIKLDESASAHGKAKQNWQKLAEFFNWGATSEIRQADEKVKKTAQLVFDGRLAEAAAAFDTALRAYESDPRASGKDEGTIRKYRGLEGGLKRKQSELQRLLSTLKKKEAEFDKKKDEEKDIEDWVERIPDEAQVRGSLAWAEREFLKCRRLMDKVQKELAQLEKEIKALAATKETLQSEIPGIEEELRTLRH